MGPDQIFKRFMDNSDNLHHQLIQQELLEQKKQMVESGVGAGSGILKSLMN